MVIRSLGNLSGSIADIESTLKRFERLTRIVPPDTEHSVYTIAWGPNSEQIVFSNGRNLLIKSIQASEILIISYSFLLMILDLFLF
jgi:hypothetical protein